MIFSSLQYLFFLPLVVFLYWRTRGSVRYWLLIGASYFFYMSWLPVYGLLLLAMTTINFWLGDALYKAVKEDRKSRKTKNLFALGLTLNLGALFYYKYTNFALQSLGAAYNWVGQTLGVVLPQAAQIPQWDVPVFNILLPLAVSFFVFEFVHYLVDIYKGDKPVKSFTHFMVFASFFPSQIAGPIKRYQDFVKQLVQPQPWSAALFYEGTGLFVQGLFKKVAIADPIGSLIFPYYTVMMNMSGPDAWLVMLGFFIQVYCDFSAYTDMGRGSALLMGIRLPENFELPYLAKDLAEFWRKWHMSLSFWLRDYVYIPLGGSKKDRWLNWRNLWITMVACGLWHGVGWHYAVFGSIQGFGLIVNREWRMFLKKFPKLEKTLENSKFAGYCGWFLTIFFVMLTFVVFRAPEMSHSLNILTSLFKGGESVLVEQIIKAGLIPIMGVYMGAWLLTEYLKKHPENSALHWLRDPKFGYGYALKLAAWTSAVILTIAARPLEAVPFVYFQF